MDLNTGKGGGMELFMKNAQMFPQSTIHFRWKTMHNLLGKHACINVPILPCICFQSSLASSFNTAPRKWLVDPTSYSDFSKCPRVVRISRISGSLPSFSLCCIHSLLGQISGTISFIFPSRSSSQAKQKRLVQIRLCSRVQIAG